jgi:hypothetical protein
LLHSPPLHLTCFLDFPLPPVSGALAESVVFGLAMVLFLPDTLVGTLGAAFLLLLPEAVVVADACEASLGAVWGMIGPGGFRAV